MRIIKVLIFSLLAITTALFPVSATNTYTTQMTSNYAGNQYWSITDAAQTGLDITGNHSVMFWINFESIRTDGETPNMVAKFGSSGNYGFTHYVYKDSTAATHTKYGIGMSSTGSNYSQCQTGYQDNMATGTWYHFAQTYNAAGQTMVTYINGTAIATTTGCGATSIYNNSAPFTIGASYVGAGANNVDGYIDDVRIYSDVLTGSEVESFYNCSLSGSAGEPDNLISNWLFNNNGEDATASNNDLTNNNTCTFQSSSLPYTNTCGGAAPAATANPVANIIWFD